VGVVTAGTGPLPPGRAFEPQAASAAQAPVIRMDRADRPYAIIIVNWPPLGVASSISAISGADTGETSRCGEARRTRGESRRHQGTSTVSTASAAVSG
jgi:hypothetical protein